MTTTYEVIGQSQFTEDHPSHYYMDTLDLHPYHILYVAHKSIGKLAVGLLLKGFLIVNVWNTVAT